MLSRFWQEEYKPRYRLPWAFMTAFWFISPAMCLIIRFYLVHENNRRQRLLDQINEASDSDVYDTGSQVIAIHDDDLDQTDRQDLKFVYPL